MILLLFGPPGCGKGTQSRLLSQWLSIPAVSTGDMLRSEAESGTELGRQLAAILATGSYVSDDMVNRIVISQLDRLNGGGLILDGYPRTVEQARFLDAALADRHLPPAVAVTLSVPEEVIVARLSSRSQCSNCRRVFNQVDHRAPYCSECGAPLIQRSDDQPEVVQRRLATYHDKTRPVLAHYEAHSHEINGNQHPDTVFQAILRALGGANGAGG